jgi:uncharacterized membrane protein
MRPTAGGGEFIGGESPLLQPIAAAVHDRHVGILAAFLAGIVGGLALAVPILRKLLAVAHDRTMAFLTGLMLGSLVALWPWKMHYFPEAIPLLGPMRPLLPQGAWWWPSIIAVIIGVGMSMLMLWLRRSGNAKDLRHTHNDV